MMSAAIMRDMAASLACYTSKRFLIHSMPWPQCSLSGLKKSPKMIRIVQISMKPAVNLAFSQMRVHWSFSSISSWSSLM